MKVVTFKKNSLCKKPHKLTTQERLKELIDDVGFLPLLLAMREEAARRCLEDDSADARTVFDVLRCVLEEI